MILIIDNYDSFTYNLVHLVGRFRDDLTVVRNDAVSGDEIEEINPDLILISPGPGRPADAGVSVEAIRRFGERIPILGVCLGHQAIGEVFGGTVTYAPTIMHGKTSRVFHDNRTIFKDLDDGFEATRYHSLVIDPASLPATLEVSARTEDHVIMGVRHKELPIEGVQFHPESVLTEAGGRMIGNWLACYGSGVAVHKNRLEDA
ncbi:MAG TPA: aminodeoxychorismate/anthranilate synthase component II [Rhodothermales bacterium]|nr:aminodeoxychorismate/anthranilate synthase component II [Rhodothermales bacterium]